MRGGAAPPFRKNLIGPGRARPFFFAKLARGPLTLRAIAFHQNGRSRGKFLCVGTTSCTLSITSVIGLLIAACFWPGSWRCIKPDNLSMRQERRPLGSRRNKPLNVRFGSKADIAARLSDVRFTSNSGHQNCPGLRSK